MLRLVPSVTQDVTIFIDFCFGSICHHTWRKTINFTNIGISKRLPDSNTEFYQIIHMSQHMDVPSCFQLKTYLPLMRFQASEMTDE